MGGREEEERQEKDRWTDEKKDGRKDRRKEGMKEGIKEGRKEPSENIFGGTKRGNEQSVTAKYELNPINHLIYFNSTLYVYAMNDIYTCIQTYTHSKIHVQSNLCFQITCD